MKLNWKNLTQNLCPECSKPLVVMDVSAFCHCGFRISKEKMDQIKYNIANGIRAGGKRNFEQGRG